MASETSTVGAAGEWQFPSFRPAAEPLKGGVDYSVLAIQAAATLFAACFGFGDAVITVPLLSLLLDISATEAVPLVTAVSTCLITLILAVDAADGKLSAQGDWADTALLILAAIVGVPLGVQALVWVDPRYIRGLLGFLLVAYGAFSIWVKVSQGSSAPEPEAKSSPTAAAPIAARVGGVAAISSTATDALAGLPWQALPFGFIAGVLGGAVAEFGPPALVYGTIQKWDPATMRTMLARFFLPLQLFALANFSAAGLWTEGIAEQFLATIPAVLVAAIIGTAVNRRIDTKYFTTVVYFMVIGLGGVCLTSAVTEAVPA